MTDTTNPAQCGSLTPLQNWVYTLHAISLKHGSGFGTDYFAPVVITGSIPGIGDNTTTVGCAHGVLNCVPFIASEALQRPALLDVNGTIYIGFGYGTTTPKANETLPYHGWLFAYKSCGTDADDCAAPQTAACFKKNHCALQQVSIFNSTPDSHGGGIWMSGRGPAAASKGTFFSVGNSCMSGENPALCPMAHGGIGFGESVVNLASLDFFAPSTFNDGYTLIQTMNYNDLDMGSGGVMIVPPSNPGIEPRHLIAGDKIGNAYLLDTSALGGFTPTPYQSFLATTATAECPANLPIYPEPSKENGCAAFISPAFWTRGSTGYLYIWGQTDTLRAFPYSSASNNFNVGAAFTSANPITAGNGGILAISAESPTNAVDSILWAVIGNSTYNQGTLQAYQLWKDGKPVLNKLWSSDADATNYFTLQRFVEPIVSNGKVYVTTDTANASGNYSLWVYGLCSQGPGGVCGDQPGSPNN